MELYQAEWCPFSHRVRQRLTELGLDFTARQVEARPEDRHAMRRATGSNEIPVLVSDEGDRIAGADAIVAWLDERYDERPDAGAHRAKARVDVPLFEEVRAAISR